MSRVFVLLILAALVIGGTMVYYATTSTTSIVLLPSDLFAKGRDVTIARVRLAGRVADAPIDYRVEPKFLLSFSLENPGGFSPSGAIKVVYDDIKPEMFAVGRDVILEGEYSHGTFTATKLMTQCPSKYEPPSPENRYKTQPDSGKNAPAIEVK